jgi:hypothetical protein
MNDELEGMWEEAVVTYSKCYPEIFQKSLRKIPKILSQVIPAGIRSKYLPNTSPGCYHNTNLPVTIIIFGKLVPLLK